MKWTWYWWRCNGPGIGGVVLAQDVTLLCLQCCGMLYHAMYDDGLPRRPHMHTHTHSQRAWARARARGGAAGRRCSPRMDSKYEVGAKSDHHLRGIAIPTTAATGTTHYATPPYSLLQHLVLVRRFAVVWCSGRGCDTLVVAPRSITNQLARSVPVTHHQYQ